ncbi:MAG TPA: outer membrane lipoprotein carrier protein LolA [Gemmatimonadaceae bacterium]|nr:outer membrane lipoprotein carrier protein LolA [Gemmatimonadaceae bacterium]
MIAATALAVAAVPPAARAQATTDSLLDRAARAVTAARTMTASFEQSLTNPDIRQTTVSRGTFTQQGPARFAFRFTEPNGDAIVADGAALWVYLPSSARGQVLKLPIAQGRQLDLITQLLTAPRTSYAIANAPGETLDGNGVAVVQLTPKLANAPFVRATLWLDTATAVVRQIEATEVSGLIRRIHFRDIRVDVPVAPGTLAFAVPAGVRVVDAGGLLGGRPPLTR